MSPTNVDARETDKFGRLAALWWDPKGPMGSLHGINPLRTRFITENVDIRDRKVLDVGCGGGILTEALSALGAHVTGIDLSEDLVQAARQHAAQHGVNVDYRYISAEQLATEHPGTFDVVTCMEVLEHIPEPQRVVAACSRLLKPAGHAFVSTINRNLKSLLFAIFGAEYVLHLLPKGSHTYGRLIRPDELRAWAGKNRLQFVGSSSVCYDPFTRKFRVVDEEDISYMMHFIRE